jgi:hypothetical protein
VVVDLRLRGLLCIERLTAARKFLHKLTRAHREALAVSETEYEWVIGPLLKAVEEYKASLAKHPKPPAANLTRF